MAAAVALLESWLGLDDIAWCVFLVVLGQVTTVTVVLLTAWLDRAKRGTTLALLAACCLYTAVVDLRRAMS